MTVGFVIVSGTIWFWAKVLIQMWKLWLCYCNVCEDFALTACRM